MSLKINNDTANGSVTLQASNTATGDVVATLPPFSTELAPRMQLMTAKTASGTSVDFTGIPSWAKKITVMLGGVSLSGTSLLLAQCGSGAIASSGYSSSSTSGTATITASTGLLIQEYSGAAITWTGSLILYNISSNVWINTSLINSYTSGNNACIGGGSVTLSGALDRIRITTVNGTDTFDAGTINILVEG